MKSVAMICVLLLVGCSNIQTRSYNVSVANESTKPITVWLTKNGPAWENGWKSPEDLAIESPKNDERISGIVIPAGRSASTGRSHGKFAPETDAILRVYLGQPGFNNLLAIGHDNPERTDITLVPGDNKIDVTDAGTLVKATRVGP